MAARVPVAALVDRAAWLFGMAPDVLAGQCRKPRYTRARFAVVMAGREARRSYNEIARGLNKECHRSIMHAEKRARAIYAADPAYREKCDALISFVHAHQARAGQ